jgi:hypothetical protein
MDDVLPGRVFVIGHDFRRQFVLARDHRATVLRWIIAIYIIVQIDADVAIAFGRIRRACLLCRIDTRDEPPALVLTILGQRKGIDVIRFRIAKEK